MLDDLAGVIETEDIDPGVVLIVWPVLVTVQHHQIAFGNGPLEIDPLA